MRRFPTRKVAIAAASVAAAIALFVSRDTVTSAVASGFASAVELTNTSEGATAVNAATATEPTGTVGAASATGEWNSGATQTNGNASNNEAEQNAIPVIAIRTDDGHVFASSGVGTGTNASAVNDAVSNAATPVVRGSGNNRSLASVRDSIQQWEEAKALTWVNVRADRSREATVLAIVNPDEIVRLGINAAGWRQVSIDGTTGWVDGRHFAATRQ